MALLKCKDCGNEISKKAKSCPHCGSPQGEKQYSLGKLLIIIIFCTFIYSLISDNSSKGPSKASSYQESYSTEKIKPPEPAWITSTSKDEMTGKFSAYAHSPETQSSKKMDFPYHDVSSWIGIGCDAKSKWVYFGFNTTPNLSNDETKNGYNLISTRIKWNDKVENVKLTQVWGEKFIHFENDKNAIEKIYTSNSVLLELQWHGQASTYFQYSLNGSSKAIDDIMEKCSAAK